MSEKNRLRQLNFTKRREAEGFKRILFWLKPDEKAYLKALLLTPYTLVMSEKNRLRQLNFTKRREAEGFKRILFWLKPDEKAYLKKALAAFRENAGEVELNPVKKVNPYQAEILKGEYPFEFEKIKYPYYTIDKPWDNLRYWNNSLPKGILVFADSHKRVKKWRAVALDGLGAFPVLWSIRYALEQRCWDLAPSRTRKINFSKFDVQTEVLRMVGDGLGAFPVLWSIRYALEQRCWDLAPSRTRKINFSKFDVQTEVLRMVGNAKLKVDARFMNSSLGFMTHPIAAQAVTVDRSIADKFPEGVLVVVVDERGELLETNAECPRREEVLLWNFSQPGLRWDEMKGTWHVAMAVLTKIFRTPDPTI